MTQAPAWACFTDGSCWHEDRVGAWAWVAFTEDTEVPEYGFGAVEDTTISRMELTGPIEFLMQLAERQGPSNVLIYSDSEYVVKGINEKRTPNLHLDLWGALCGLVVQHEHVEFEHVRGHSGSFWNHEADRIASKTRKEYRRGKTHKEPT